MGQRMMWQEIKEAFPDEWVALANYEVKSEAPYGDIIGDLVAHSANEREFTEQIKSLPPDISGLDIRFTGEILPDNPIGPILWQA